MSRRVYALLVGIDEYPAPIPPLRGCVNDITAVEHLLKARLAADEYLPPKVLKNAEATRQAVIDGFTHLREAGPDDVALFYYCGHGSQERTPPEFWHLEPDRLNETLVCYDSRLADNFDLADKELAKLIAVVAARGAHVLIILDSCHSGSGTRVTESVGVRRAPTDLRERPLSSFLVTPEEVAALTAQGESRNLAGVQSGWVKLPWGRHIVMSACRDDEEAKETNVDGLMRGAFSYFLINTLQGAGAGWTYRDLCKRVNALVRTKVARQSPLIEAPTARELDQPFLGGAIQAHPHYFTAMFDRKNGWIIDGGVVHGIESSIGDEATLLALFPVESREEQLYALDGKIGEARVIERMTASSKITIKLGDGNQSPDQETTYKAVIIAAPMAARGVQIVGDGQSAALARTALAQAGAGGRPSMHIREVAEGAELKLITGVDGYRIMRAADDRPLVIDIRKTDAAGARQAIERLEHIARWLRVAELSNPTSRIRPDDIELSIELSPDPDASAESAPRLFDVENRGGELRLTYTFNRGQWEEPWFKVKIKNKSNRRLYCILLDLTETYQISSGLIPGGGVWLDPGQETYAFAAEPIFASIPDELWKQGVGEIKDLLKLIVCDDECDATLLDQDELDVSVRANVTRESPRNTLERLMQRTTRALGKRPERERLADWMTKEVSVTTVRPLESIQLPTNGEVILWPQVKVAGHPTFKAHLGLGTLPQASQELKASHELGRAAEPGGYWVTPKLPGLLRDDPSVAQPLQLSSGRSGDAGLSVLELTQIDPATMASVTPEQPLVVRLGESLLEVDEHVLPVGYDGEFFLPLGRARRAGGDVEVLIERLPPPLVDSRSLTGSIRILFEKVIAKGFGREFKYPSLAIAEADVHGGVSYDHDYGRVQARVAVARRILLYVHGIIGDTRGMVASARHQLTVDPPIPALADRYDLILSFDYENLQTTIEENARLLKQRLAGAGLGPQHGKILHIVAHSTGGLVSRWFIEHEGGNQVVEHLVMLGAPNAGLPWARVEDLALTALGIGLNGLSTAPWPAKVLGGLVRGLEAIDVSRGRMNPQSDFMRNLAASPDPGVRYTTIAGNTSKVAWPDDEQKKRFQRLISRLTPQQFPHGGTPLAFFSEPNDIAVSVASIQSTPAGRIPSPHRDHEIACDHISYFNTEAGLRALADALG
jgi:hypothetical protein